MVRSLKRSLAAKRAWRTRRARYGPSGMSRARWSFNYKVFRKPRPRRKKLFR